MVRVALAGDTMLGRGVGERLLEVGPEALFSPEVREAVAGADLFLVNLECCVSERGRPWTRPGKPFFFRAPPVAVQALKWLGVDCVTLANNHALDFGPVALADTLALLHEAGISCVGAGRDVGSARAVATLEAGQARIAVVGVTDHPEDFAAGPSSPGVAYADLSRGVPDWLLEAVRGSDADMVIVTVHWGPNMVTEPMGYIRSASRELLAAGASVVAGHSAHVFHGVSGSVLFDLGDLIDDYAVDRLLRNDLGVLMVATIEDRGSGGNGVQGEGVHGSGGGGIKGARGGGGGNGGGGNGGGPIGGLRRLEAVPIALDYGFTRLARDEEYAWIRRRFTEACAAFGTAVTDTGERLVVTP